MLIIVLDIAIVKLTLTTAEDRVEEMKLDLNVYTKLCDSAKFSKPHKLTFLFCRNHKQEVALALAIIVMQEYANYLQQHAV